MRNRVILGAVFFYLICCMSNIAQGVISFYGAQPGDTRYSTQNGPYWIYTGDLTGDGIDDVVNVNWSSNSVSFLQGNGDGTFVAAVNMAVGAANSYPGWIDGADLDGDGDIDLVVSCRGANSVYVIQNNGGAFGTWPVIPYATALNNPAYLDLVDVDEDGKLDIVVAHDYNYSASVTWKKNNWSVAGTCSFIAGGTITYADTQTPEQFYFADFDGDGKQDMVMTAQNNQNAGRYRWYLFLGNGSGTYTFSLYKDVQHSYNGGIIVADFDGNGKPDIFTYDSYDIGYPNDSTFYASLYWNTSVATSPSFTLSYYQFGSYVRHAVPADVNGDGYIDIICPAYGADRVYVLLSKGYRSYGMDSYTTQNEPWRVEAADMDNDGDSDFVVMCRNAGGIGSAQVFINDSKGGFNTVVTYTTANGPMFLSLKDVSGDGTKDILYTAYNSNQFGIVKNPLGKYRRAYKPIGTLPSNPVRADFNNDGYDEMAFILSSRDVNIWGTGSTHGTFNLVSKLTVADGINELCAGDFDGDGDLDLAVINNSDSTFTILTNNGSGTMTKGTSYDVGNGAKSIASGDFDGDGDIDIVLTTADAENVSVFLNNGSGAFTKSGSYTAGSDPRSIAVADFNMDGKQDFVVANWGGNTLSYFVNSGSGNFAAAVEITCGDSPAIVIASDINLDGYPDMATANSGAVDNIGVILSDGSGGFNAVQQYNVDVDPLGIDFADFDLDGDLDMVAVNSTSASVSILENDGSGVYTVTNYAGLLGTNPYAVTAIDMDRSGVRDVVVACGGDSQMYTFIDIFSNPKPQVHGVSKTLVDSVAGDTISIYGYNFTGAFSVELTDTAGTAFSTYTVSTGSKIINAQIPSGIASGIYNIIVTSPSGANTKSFASVRIASAPTATASAAPVSGTVPLAVAFSGNGSDIDGSITKYEWDFDGNGTYDWSSTTTGNVTYSYTETGTYNSVFRVTDSTGLFSTATIQISVSAAATTGGGTTTTTVSTWITPSATSGTAPLSVSFTVDEARKGVLYLWDFDGDSVYDLSSTTTGNTSFTYSLGGTYTPGIKIIRADGAIMTTSVSITVANGDSPPAVTANLDTTGTIYPGTTVAFSASATPGGSKSISLYEWDFDGDGSFDYGDTSGAAVFVYDSAGTYDAKVVVTDSDGVASSVTVNLTVEAAASFFVTMHAPASGTSVYGDAVPVSAIAGPDSLFKSIQFQFRASGDSNWSNLGSSITTAFYRYWATIDSTVLSSGGSYSVRAVATDIYDTQYYSSEISLLVSSVSPTITGYYVSAGQKGIIKIYSSKNNVLELSDGTSVSIPYNAISGNGELTITQLASNPHPTSNEEYFSGQFYTIALSQGLSLSKLAKVVISYPDDDNDGIVDGTTISASSLKIIRFSTLSNKWEYLYDGSVDTDKHQVIGYSAGFSDFALATSIADAVSSTTTSSISSAGSSGGGCFLATSAFERKGESRVVSNWTGAYHLSPENLNKLNELRRFRDKKLLPSASGRQFVRLYYSLGPAAAELIRDNEPVKRLVRQFFLQPVVTGLENKR